MTKDVKTGDCFRLDHLIKAHLEKIAVEKNTSPDVKAECRDIHTKVNHIQSYYYNYNIRNISWKA